MYSLTIHGGVLNVSEKSFRNYAKHNKYLRNLELHWRECLHEYLEIGESLLKKNFAAMAVVEEIIQLVVVALRNHHKYHLLEQIFHLNH